MNILNNLIAMTAVSDRLQRHLTGDRGRDFSIAICNAVEAMHLSRSRVLGDYHFKICSTKVSGDDMVFSIDSEISILDYEGDELHSRITMSCKVVVKLCEENHAPEVLYFCIEDEQVVCEVLEPEMVH